MIRLPSRWFVASIVLSLILGVQGNADDARPAPAHEAQRSPADWLIDGSWAVAKVSRGGSDRELYLENGLVRRTFRLAPGAATVGLDHLGTHESFLRSVRPEAILEFDGTKVEVGGLIGAKIHNFLDPQGARRPQGRPGGMIFGNSPCLCSRWGLDYFAKLRQFFEQTGCGVLEHDGSYPGDVCASTNHPGHSGWPTRNGSSGRRSPVFYQWCRGRGIYLNVPDWYFLAGSTKIGMGYRETNWSLPRDEQEIIERQNIFDGTWEKTPSMGWMFVPLTEYQGGGAAATIEPLKEHLPHYEARLANLFGAGVQACYRGPRLYDTDETKAVVKRWVDFYKQHRPILDSRPHPPPPPRRPRLGRLAPRQSRSARSAAWR